MRVNQIQQILHTDFNRRAVLIAAQGYCLRYNISQYELSQNLPANFPEIIEWVKKTILELGLEGEQSDQIILEALLQEETRQNEEARRVGDVQTAIESQTQYYITGMEEVRKYLEEEGGRFTREERIAIYLNCKSLGEVHDLVGTERLVEFASEVSPVSKSRYARDENANSSKRAKYYTDEVLRRILRQEVEHYGLTFERLREKADSQPDSKLATRMLRIGSEILDVEF